MENEPGSDPQTKAPPNRTKGLCNFPGCTKWLQRHSGGFCWAHGRKQGRRLCRVDGCGNIVINRGVCTKHGARRTRCKVEGCTSHAVVRGGLCGRHGKIRLLREKERREARAQELLDEADAFVSTDDKNGEDEEEGKEFEEDEEDGVDDVMRKKETVGSVGSSEMGRCTELLETKLGSGPQTRARPRTTSRLCKFPGCTKWPQRYSGGFCWAHGRKQEKRLCRVDGCSNIVINRGVCTKHGARRTRCGVEGCTSFAAVKGGLCQRHGDERSARSEEDREDRAPRAVPGGLRRKRGGGERSPRRPKANPVGEEVAEKIGALEEKEGREAPSEEPSVEAAALESSDEGGDGGDAGGPGEEDGVNETDTRIVAREKETDGSVGTDDRDNAAAEPKEGREAPSEKPSDEAAALESSGEGNDDCGDLGGHGEEDGVDKMDTRIVAREKETDRSVGTDDRGDAAAVSELCPEDEMDRCTETREKRPRKNKKAGAPSQTKQNRKRYVYICRHEGCTKHVLRGGVCWRHGAKRKRRSDGDDDVALRKQACPKLPREEGNQKGETEEETVGDATGGGKTAPSAGCESRPLERGGLREKHSERWCQVEGCKNKARKGGVCIRHGAPGAKKTAERTCQVEGCGKWRYGRGGGRWCFHHMPLGEKARYRCSVEGCTEWRKRGGKCIAHSSATCGREGCDRKAYRGEACYLHWRLYADPCSVKGCVELSDRGGLCQEHRLEREQRDARRQELLEEEAALERTADEEGKDEEEGNSEHNEEDGVDEMDACIVIRKKKTDGSVGSNECENNKKTDVVHQMIMGIDPSLAAKSPVVQHQRLGKMQATAGQKRPAATTVAPATSQRPQKQRGQEEPSGHRFQQQLRDLWRMGFTDRLANIRALAMSRGDFVEAIQIILSEGCEDETPSALKEGTRDETGDGDASQLQPLYPSCLRNQEARQEVRMPQQHQLQGQGSRGKNLDVHDEHRAQQLLPSVAQGESNLGNVASTTSVVDLTRGNKDNISSMQRLEERAAQIEASCRLLEPHLSSPSECTPHLIRRCRSLEEELRRVRLRIALLRSQEILDGDNHDDEQLKKPKNDGPPCKEKENLFLCTTEEEVLLYLDANKK